MECYLIDRFVVPTVEEPVGAKHHENHENGAADHENLKLVQNKDHPHREANEREASKR